MPGGYVDAAADGAPLTDAGPDIVVPEGCELTKEPKDASACVDSNVGVFVDGATGADANPGTKDLPFKTLGAALMHGGGRPRVYVCAGTYAEHVKMTSAVSIYGGFACGSWTYNAQKAAVSPSDVGYALDVEKVAGAFEIADVSFTAAAGTDAATSSIAAFVNASPSVTLRRVALNAGKGFAGTTPTKAADGALMSSMPTASSLNGNGGDAANGGLAQLCTCVGGGTTKGGGGGSLNSPGNAGETAPATPDPVGATGLGSSVIECAGGQGGRPGSNAPAASAAAGATTPGTLTESGWAPSSGTKGSYGSAGQGGGGGGGSGGGGGGGACGGCGGAGGDGGEGGGASIALATLDSPVEVIASTLATSDAGTGGAGGAGGDGIGGGTKGNQGGAACPGGNGGKGGNGADGGGGAGGISVGVLFKEGKPTIHATITTGAKGAAGNGAVDGQKADTLELQ